MRLQRLGSRRTIVVGLTAAVALALPPAVAGIAGASSVPPGAAAEPPITLSVPKTLTGYTDGKRTWTELEVRLKTSLGEPFELWSTRSSYSQPIHTAWHSSAGTVALPDVGVTEFSKLRKFFTIRAQKAGSSTVHTFRRPACLNSWGAQRVTPDAPATSPYPQECYSTLYGLGAIQGIQAGWSTPALSVYRMPYLAPGRYDVTVRIASKYSEALGLGADAAVRQLTLKVLDESRRPSTGRAEQGRSRLARPAATEPTRPSAGAAGDTRPDLKSLPAWGISVASNGNFLRFFANVWNAGDSPLVVDGFRRADEDEMDAYQYFFDADGEQTGYQQVGSMHWDAKASHQHWHFEDFARYSLLDADKVEAVRSKKEAWCLANTDAVDTTVPNASWDPYNTELSTACGGYSALSIREVLLSGWGDTYAQFRAGQSFDLRGLPNGKYYIAVIANPENRLVEASTDNNIAYRRVIIGGAEGARTVRVPQVGLVVEPEFN